MRAIVVLSVLCVVGYVLVDVYDFDLYVKQIGAPNTIENEKEFVDQLREGMLQRKETVQLSFKGSRDDVNEYVKQAVDEVFHIDKDDTTTDYDYLRFVYKGTEISIRGIVNSFSITYHIDYYETLEQTKEVDRIIAKVLKELEIQKKSDYEKIKAIHDYIIVNSSYDVKMEKTSAYENLIDKKSICQGYALLTYKMMKEAGIDCRVITGKGKDVNHAWNIVKLDNKWYNIDCTWDDPLCDDQKSRLEYTYFLKSNADFHDHIRDAEYETIEFNQSYTMSEKSYKK